MIKIGYFNTGIVDASKERTKIRLEKGARLIFKGTCSLGVGCRINVSRNGELVFGNNFSATSRSTFYSNKKIEFGNDCLVSWDCLFMDTDSHKIFQNEEHINQNAEICIGNHVWIGCRATILKGVSIANDSVIGAGAVITKDCISERCVYAGNPARIVKSDVDWSRE